MKGLLMIRSYYRNMQLGRKLLLTYVLLIMLPTVTLASLTYEKSSTMVEEQVIKQTQKSFELANAFITYKLNNVKDVSSILFMNNTLNEILSRSNINYPLVQQIDDYNQLTNILRSGLTSREVYSVRLYVGNDALFARENMLIHSLSKVKETLWYKSMLANTESIYCRSTYEYDYKDARGVQNIISCVRPLAENAKTGEPLGVLSIDVSETSIRQVIDQTNITKSGQVYLLDAGGYVISAQDSKRIGTFFEQTRFWGDAWEARSGSFTYSKNGKSSIIIHEQVEGTKWKLVAVIPQEEIVGGSMQLSRDLIAIAAIVIVLAVLTAIGVSTSITRRIRELFVHINHIEKERWDYQVKAQSTDEIGLLQHHFNRMSMNMKLLIQEKYQAEAAKKGAELKALQAQINPHFLYNTLELIHWMAMKHRAKDISDIVGRLAKFFRLSLSKGKDVISIRDELEHVRTYLDIQSQRFSGKLHYTVEADPEVESYMTVKLILQPLVENAILHGILESKDKAGHITIRAYRQADDILLEVEDDGTGMSAQALAGILEPSESGGYGINNVAEKLKLYYGTEYGLSYESELGDGTIAHVRIPAVPHNA